LSLYPEIGTCHQGSRCREILQKVASDQARNECAFDRRCRRGGHETGRCTPGGEICDGQVLCVEVSVNGFNGVETGLLVPASKDP
jgi:hypothetical protein